MINIALVDDESNILISVSLALETEGFKVDTFNNGEEAIRGLESKKYDLGLFDIKMPRMNGNELLIKVRSSNNLELRNMPIIFLTSKDQEQDEIIGLKMGAADYIKKPFSQKLLNERNRTVLRVHSNRINNENKNVEVLIFLVLYLLISCSIHSLLTHSTPLVTYILHQDQEHIYSYCLWHQFSYGDPRNSFLPKDIHQIEYLHLFLNNFHNSKVLR